jgi:nucleoside-diphosphate-sugar epimerase
MDKAMDKALKEPMDGGKTVMVLGANGRLGRAAVAAFAAAGWAVRAVVRPHGHRAAPAAWPAGVRLVSADALDTDALAPAAQGVDVIVNALNPDYTQWDRLLPPLTAAVIALAERSGTTLMLAGSVYNFGKQLPPVLTEDTPFVGNHPKARQRIALEAALAEAAAQRGVRSIVIRAGDFLGDEGTWIDLAMAKGLARGRFVQPGATDLQHAWAWLPDLAQVFVRVAGIARADRAAAGGQAVLPAHAVLHYAGLTLTGAQLQQAFEAALGRPLQTAGLPWWLLRLVSPVAAMPRALLEMRHLWQRPHQLDETRLAALIGPVPHTPLDAVVRECLARLPENLRPVPAPIPAPATPQVRTSSRPAG